MSYKFTNKDWFDYISKLSDRKINKSSASGITVWAILTVLVLIVFKIVGIMENIILNRATLLSLINYFSFLMNSIFFIYLVINFIFSSTRKKGGNRLISHTDMKTLNIIIYSLYPILLIAIFSNLFLIFNFKKFYIPKLIYILIITLYILFFIAFIFIKKNIKIESNQGQSIGMEYNNPNIKPQKIISFIYLLPFGFYYIYTFLYIKGKESFIINFNMLYFALYSVGFLLGLIILSINFSNSIASNWLIELERSIILDNLSVEDIKKMYLSTENYTIF